MASIAEILLAKGNAAAANTLQRGNIYADLIRNLSSVPGQFMQQQRALEQDRIKQQIQQQQLQVGQQDLQLGGLKLADAQREQQDRDYLGTLLNDPSVLDPDTGRPNQQALIQRAVSAGHGQNLGQIIDLTNHMLKSSDEADARDDADRKRDLEEMGVGAQKVAAGGYQPGDLHLLVTYYANPKRRGGARISPEQANSWLGETDPARVKQITQMLMAGTAAGKAETETENVAPGASVIVKRHPELGAVFTAPEKKETPTAASLAATANDPKQPPPVRESARAALADLPETKLHDETARHNQRMEEISTMTAGREQAAQSETARHNKAMEVAAGDALVKVEHQDANGNTVIEWKPKGEVRGQTFNKPLSGTLQNRLASATAVNQTGNDIIAKLSDPAVAAMVGPVMGRFNTLRDFLGNPPPELSELAGAIESYALANMGVHGMRSSEGAAKINAMLNEKGTPASLIAKIKGLQGFSTHLLENEGRTVPTVPAATSQTTAPVVTNPFRR